MGFELFLLTLSKKERDLLDKTMDLADEMSDVFDEVMFQSMIMTMMDKYEAEHPEFDTVEKLGEMLEITKNIHANLGKMKNNKEVYHELRRNSDDWV